MMRLNGERGKGMYRRKIGATKRAEWEGEN
jgi:stalled ribosome alternative rescue factor ArfA